MRCVSIFLASSASAKSALPLAASSLLQEALGPGRRFLATNRNVTGGVWSCHESTESQPTNMDVAVRSYDKNVLSQTCWASIPTVDMFSGGRILGWDQQTTQLWSCETSVLNWSSTVKSIGATSGLPSRILRSKPDEILDSKFSTE